MAAQGAFGTGFYDSSTRTIVGTMLWTEYRPVIKIGPKGALGCHEIRPIHSAPSLGQSIDRLFRTPIRVGSGAWQKTVKVSGNPDVGIQVSHTAIRYYLLDHKDEKVKVPTII